MTILRTALPVSPLGCRGEARLWLELIVGNLPGVRSASVNSRTEMAYVEYDPELTDPGELFAAIQRWGLAPDTGPDWLEPEVTGSTGGLASGGYG